LAVIFDAPPIQFDKKDIFNEAENTETYSK